MLKLSEVPEHRRAKAEYWVKIISDHSKSGLPIKQYCQAEGINPSTFYYWSQYLNGKIASPCAIAHKHKKEQVTEKNTQKLIGLKISPSGKAMNPPIKQDAVCALYFPNGSFLKVYDVNILPELLKGLT